MSRISQFAATNEDRGAIQSLIAASPLCNFVGSLDGMIEPAALLAKEMVSRAPQVCDQIYSFSHKPPLGGLLIIDNLPVIGRTEVLSLAIAHILGSPLKIEAEGDYVITIKERIEYISPRPSFANSREFTFHTDLSYADFPPDYLQLFCHEFEGSIGGNSTFCDIYKAVSTLSPSDIGILTQPLFLFPAPAHYKGKSEQLRPVLSQGENGWEARFRRDGIQTDDKDAIVAFARFVDAIQHNSFEAKMAPGTLVAFDNKSFLHGRTGYVSGGSRAIDRVFVSRNAEQKGEYENN